MTSVSVRSRQLTFSFLGLFGILPVSQGSFSRGICDVFPGLGLYHSVRISPKRPSPARSIQLASVARLPSDAWRKFSDWLFRS